MKEIVKIELENEMDLILANRRTMKLAELCGLSLTAQTALATAVSEVARFALPNKKTFLKLGINSTLATKQISAVICNAFEHGNGTEAINFAKRLIAEVLITKENGCYDVQLNQPLKPSHLITDAKIESFIQYFKTEPPSSPYDDIRKKNILLLELSQKLKASENQYRELTDTLPLMMFLANPAGEIIYTNSWLASYFELITIAPFSGQDLIHPEDYDQLTTDWERNFTSGRLFRAEARLKNKKNNTYLWHLISILPIKDQSNKITQWTGFFVDIHAQKLIEETLKDNVELRETQKKLVDNQKKLEEKIDELNISNHELEQFAYIASHDLQEPLRKIATFSILLGEKLADSDSDSKTYLSKIVTSSNRMSNLIKDVLDWSRIARGSEELSPVDLNIVLEGVKSELELVIQNKSAIIQTSVLPTVSGIHSQITQLFCNLLGNALKFCTTTPVIKVNARNLDRNDIVLNTKLDASRNYTEVTVSDNGIGFEQHYAVRIFKIFQRLNARSEYKGTGIGLAICKKIVENHRGTISATSMPGHGASFSIIIPLTN
jgi:PAS domain S-box-containing protein